MRYPAKIVALSIARAPLNSWFQKVWQIDQNMANWHTQRDGCNSDITYKDNF